MIECFDEITTKGNELVSEYLNKYQTKLYVEYATNLASTGVLARELGLPDSRISEMKSGRRRLRSDEALIIQEKYGIPSTSNSLWMIAEYMELSTLRETIINNGLELNLIKLIDFFNSKKYMDTLFGSRIKGLWESTDKLAVFQKLINNKDFGFWCDAAECLFSTLTTCQISDEFITNLMFYKDVQGITCSNGIFRYDLPLTKPLLIYSELLNNVDSKLRIPLFNESKYDASPIIELLLINKINRLLKSPTYKNLIIEDKSSLLGFRIDRQSNKPCSREYVVSGKVVWKGTNFQLSTPIKEAPSFYSQFDDEFMSCTNEELKEAVYEYSREELIYTEQYQYFLSIELTGKPGSLISRRFLIHISNRSHLFESIDKVFSELGIQHTNQSSGIKRSLAENGAFVPTATYIN